MLNNGSLEHTFLRLWASRFDVYAEQQSNGSYLKVEESLTAEVIKRHLRQEITVGFYQLDKNNMVKWLCWDLDPEKLDDPLLTAKTIINECISQPNPKTPRFHKKALLLEASRYPDPSYHVWVFFEPLPVPAKVARWLGLKILEHANVNPKLVEVFPKQTKLTKDRPYGNLVKTPLGLHKVAHKWSHFLNLENLKPLSANCVFSVQGVSFSEADLAGIYRFEDTKHVQSRFELPRNYRSLEEEEWIARWLTMRWIPGHRNQLELSFLGLCIKQGVAFDSAYRVIDRVCYITNDEEKLQRIQLVKYHYEQRRNLGSQLKGVSGIRELLRSLRTKLRKSYSNLRMKNREERVKQTESLTLQWKLAQSFSMMTPNTVMPA